MNMWKYISMAALAMMMVACSNDDAAIDNAQGKVMTLTTTLKMADNASTRTLTDETTQITAEWAVGDQFTISYQTTANDISDPTDKSGYGVAEVKSVSGGTATVQATLADALNGGAIDFSYPHAHNDPGTDPNTDQVGTLDDINANFACMYGSGTMSVSGTTVSIDDGGVTMTQEICIWKFTFSDGTNDITSAITNLKLAFQYVTYDVNPTSQPAIYVAIYDGFPYTTGGVTITATTASGVYTASKPSVTLQVGQMYESDVALSLIPGPLAGKFTINASGNKVSFSQGNLQATYNGSSWSWAFATNQWDYIGNAEGNTKVSASTPFVSGYSGSSTTVDLFGWVGASSNWTGAAQYGISNSTVTNNVDGYGNVSSEALKADWGTTMGTGWRTLTKDEWTYLLNTRVTGALVNGTSDAHYTQAVINTDGTAVKGLIIFPDGYVGETPTGVTWGTINDKSDFTTTCTSAGWLALNAAGCIFLPAAGYREGSTVTDAGVGAGYWSSSSSNATYAFGIYFESNYFAYQYAGSRKYGFCVRLVQDVE